MIFWSGSVPTWENKNQIIVSVHLGNDDKKVEVQLSDGTKEAPFHWEIGGARTIPIASGNRPEPDETAISLLLEFYG